MSKFYFLRVAAYFCQKGKNGTNKEIYRALLVTFFCFYSRFNLGDCNTLGMAHPDSSFPDYCLCKGDGHNVIIV